MLWTLRALLLLLCLSFCAQAQTRTLGLYFEQPRDLDAESGAVMREELRQLLAPAELEVIWKPLADRKAGQNFDLVAVVSFEGSCSADKPAHLAGPVSLADTSISDGHVLPFFHIDCSRVIAMLGSQTAPPILGRALARVAAHEIYHIVAQTAEHQERGVAKPSFSSRDLTAARFELDSWSLDLMRLKPVPVQVTAPTSEESNLLSER